MEATIIFLLMVNCIIEICTLCICLKTIDTVKLNLNNTKNKKINANSDVIDADESSYKKKSMLSQIFMKAISIPDDYEDDELDLFKDNEEDKKPVKHVKKEKPTTMKAFADVYEFMEYVSARHLNIYDTVTSKYKKVEALDKIISSGTNDENVLIYFDDGSAGVFSPFKYARTVA